MPNATHGILQARDTKSVACDLGLGALPCGRMSHAAAAAAAAVLLSDKRQLSLLALLLSSDSICSKHTLYCPFPEGQALNLFSFDPKAVKLMNT